MVPCSLFGGSLSGGAQFSVATTTDFDGRSNTHESPFSLPPLKAAGFTVGPMMAAKTVYVFFDPQCPHCGRLWEASKPIADKLRMVWIPVAILNQNSAPQGTALLAASDAVA